MRIGMLAYPSVGGSGVVASELAHALVKRGHKVHFFSYKTPFRLTEYTEGLTTHVVDIASYPLFEHPPYLLSLVGKVLEVAAYEGIDVIHAHYMFPHTFAGMLIRMAHTPPIPLVTTVHGTDVTKMGLEPPLSYLFPLGIQQSDAVTAVSADLRARVLALGVDVPIEVIPNFLPAAEPMRQCVKRARFAKSHEAILIHASNFRPVKRIDWVVKIFAGVRKTKPAKLLLIGDGPDLAMAHRVAQELDVREDIHFLGSQRDLADFLRISDVFLLPSLEESFGLSALEAMGEGVPVVASNAGGLSEVVKNQQTGILCPVNDLDAHIAAVHMILDHYVTYSQNAKKHAKETFSAEAIVPAYERVYQRILRR